MSCYFGFHTGKKGIHLLSTTVLEQGQKLIAAVTPYEAQISRRGLKNARKIMDQFIALQMSPVLIGLSDTRKIQHNAADITRKRFAQIFLNDTVAAIAVGDTGQRIRSYGDIQISVSFLEWE